MGLGKATLSLSKLPHQEWVLPELPTWMAMGRSNVGKSSLLNALIHPQELFRSGSTPGVTRGLIGADIEMGRKRLFLLDLPGWGYSVRHEQETRGWEELGEKVLSTYHADLTQIIWLVDPRRPFDKNEKIILNWLGQHNWFLVFTKADQVKRSERKKVEQAWALATERSIEKPLWVSTKDGEGMSDLLKRAQSFVRRLSEQA